VREPKTAFEYGRLLDTYLLPAIGAKRIVDVSRADVARLHSSLRRMPRQANLVTSVIPAVWGWAARRDEAEFTRNPSSSRRYPEKRCERFLSSGELARLGDTLRLAETEGLPWQDTEPQSKHGAKSESRRSVLAIAAIQLSILTGMRPREVLDLEWSHLDFERGALFLPDSKTGLRVLSLGVQLWTFSPSREHADRIPLSEIGGRAVPDIGMDRAPIAKRAEKPVFHPGRRGRTFLLVAGSVVNAGPEFVQWFRRRLYAET